MSLEPGVLLLVLLSALFHASWNALVKAGRDKLVMQTYVICVPGFVSLFLLPFLPAPEPASWPFLAASVVIHGIYYATLIYAYEHGDLSQVYPIARGTAPALVALFAWLLAAETLSPAEILGLAILSSGIISLSRLARLLTKMEQPREGEVKAIIFAALTALTIGAYATADGMGVRNAGSKFGYIAWLFVLEALPLLAFAMWQRRASLRESFGGPLKKGVAGGMIGGIGYAIAIWAMSVAPLAHVVAVRETSVIIAAFIGTRMMAEPFGRRRIAAAVAIAGGAALLNLGSRW